MDLDEGVCADCGKPLGARVNWCLAGNGRAYHNDCEPGPEPEPREEPEESLTEHAERVARRAIHGPGSRALEEDQA